MSGWELPDGLVFVETGEVDVGVCYTRAPRWQRVLFPWVRRADERARVAREATLRSFMGQLRSMPLTLMPNPTNREDSP